MNISETDKKALLVFGTSFLIFMLLTKKKKSKKTEDGSAVPSPESRKTEKIPKMNPKDAAKNPKAKEAYTAMKAYITAYNAKEPQSALDELNREIQKDMSVKVFRRAYDGKFIVTDMSGKEIMSNA